MAKGRLEFDLPEESIAFRAAQDGGKWKSIVWNLDQRLRENKHGNGVLDTFEFRNILIVLMSDNGVVFDD